MDCCVIEEKGISIVLLGNPKCQKIFLQIHDLNNGETHSAEIKM